MPSKRQHGRKSAGGAPGAKSVSRRAKAGDERNTAEIAAGLELSNREISWLEFNRRVLSQATDSRSPLLERVRFLGIYTSNLDEFFMKRVGGLKRQAASAVVSRSPDGMTANHQLGAIRRMLEPMLKEQADVFTNEIKPALAAAGVELLNFTDLEGQEKDEAEAYFRTEVFPVLTPLAVDPGHPFPFMSNLSMNIGVTLRHPSRGERLFARLKIPHVFPRWIPLNDQADGRYRFLSLVDLVRHNLGALFPEMMVVDVMPFRVTRNADVERDEEDADDLLELVEEELRARRFARVVRLEHKLNADPWMLQFLREELDLHPDDVYEMPGMMDYADLKAIADIGLPEHTFTPWIPLIPPELADEDTDIFSVIRKQNLLVHHPYESFGASVERFVRTAANDPHVLAIKMTVYRTGDDSPFIKTLIHAAELGKLVLVLVELKARFDEARNIYWAHELEKAGVHVVYGVVGFKTHCKTTLVIRQETDGVRSYAHIGTGNYNASTAKLYTDLGLFTCERAITDEVVELFNYLTGRSLKRDYKKLLVAPVNMKDTVLAKIAREAQNQRDGKPAWIVAKMNSLEDRDVIRALYEASNAGVQIDLTVRGFCCLRPGVPGMSENIRVISIIGRFLEHSRIFVFANAATDPLDADFAIGSADWMSRNLQYRVEAVVPIEDRPLRARLWEILQSGLNDQRLAWDLKHDGTYVQRMPKAGTTGPETLGTQQVLMNLTRQRIAPASTSASLRAVTGREAR